MSLSEAQRIAEVRVLLRSLSNTDRLRELPLVRAALGAAGEESGTANLAALMQRRLDAVLEQLDSRARAIIVRCDLAGETHRAVANDLGIGERYFYRERRRALAELAGHLVVSDTRACGLIESDPLDGVIGMASALRNAGRAREAAAILESAHASQASARSRASLAIALADAAAKAEHHARALQWIARGRQDLAAADPTSEAIVAACEFDLVEARVDNAEGRFGTAQDRARSVTRRLVGIDPSPARDRIAAALATSYLWQSEAQIMRGHYSDGLALALEGQSALHRVAGVAVPAAQIDVLVAVACARFFVTGSLARAADDFGIAYSRAVALGRAGDIAKIAASIALVSSLAGDAQRSATFARTALTVGRRALTASERTGISLDLVQGFVTRRDFSAGRSLIDDAMPHARGIVKQILLISDAELQLAAGNTDDAFALARRASREIENAGNVRFLGTSHRIEAEALAALGRRSAAAHRISDALDCLNVGGHPVTRYRAYKSSARITGNRVHNATARELHAGLIG